MQPHNGEDFPIILTKVILLGVLILTCLVLFIFAPKQIISNDFPFVVATSLAISDESNLLLYDYEVYATSDRFEQGLIDDVTETKATFRERNEIMAIKVYGLSNRIEYKEDYIVIYNQDTPELNIEYYLIKDMIFDEMSFPCRTFIVLINDLKPVVNHIYIGVVLFITLAILAPATIKFIKYMTILERINNK
ncbi:MAG: hypothetical protein RBQ71_02640 [Acholeplasmataceae bacterium]|jgi:hypothetical protein|nr:hypothetical protein [Acholeplasmataceae bacterium]